MDSLEALKRAVTESGQLSQKGLHEEALKLLDRVIADAKREHRTRWVRILTRHAAVIAGLTQDLDSAHHYCEELVTWSPESPMAQYALADVLFRQGNVYLAKRHAAKAYSL